MPEFSYIALPDVLEAASQEEIEECLVDDSHEPVPDLSELSAADEDERFVRRLSNIVKEAEGAVDSYLADRYDVPLESTPPVIRGIVLSFVKYRIFSRRVVSPEIEEEYDAAMSRLIALSVGAAKLPGMEKDRRSRVRFGTTDIQTKISRLL